MTEMEYLRGREQKLRDTNESTNERVKWFAFGTMGMLVGLGAWQIVYLRAYFRWVCKSLSTLNYIAQKPRFSIADFSESQVEAFNLAERGDNHSMPCPVVVCIRSRFFMSANHDAIWYAKIYNPRQFLPPFSCLLQRLVLR